MLNTTSMFITFHGRLEDTTKAFYENLAANETYHVVRELFLELSKENAKHKDMILRTYREVITDAFEGGFPLTELNENNYKIKAFNTEDMNLTDILKKAIELEGKNLRFCEDASRSINGLLIDVSQAFGWVKKRKEKRSQKLKNVCI